MGAQSTITLTRKEAEDQYMAHKAEILMRKKRAKWQADLDLMNDSVLTYKLENMAEEKAALENTTPSYNFSISDTEADSVVGKRY